MSDNTDTNFQSAKTFDSLKALMAEAADYAEANLGTRFACIAIGSALVGAAIIMIVQAARKRGWL